MLLVNSASRPVHQRLFGRLFQRLQAAVPPGLEVFFGVASCWVVDPLVPSPTAWQRVDASAVARLEQVTASVATAARTREVCHHPAWMRR